MEHPLPEALLLLAWNRGQKLPLPSLGIQISCALLLELALRNRVAIGESVELVNPVPTVNEALDEALTELVRSPRMRTLECVRAFAILAEQGARRRLEAVGALPEAELPAGSRLRTLLELELRAVLFAGAAPDARTLCLLGIHHAFADEVALWGPEAPRARERAGQLLQHNEHPAGIDQVLAAARSILGS